MSNSNHATVRSTLQPGAKLPEWLSTLDATITTAAQSTEVQGDPTAGPAFNGLKKALSQTQDSFDNRQKLALALVAAIKALHIDVGALRVATRTYEAAIDALASGNAQLIAKAGLQSRAVSGPLAPLGKVTVVRSKPGKHLGDAIITWPAAPGATSYALEANFTTKDPSGPFTPLASGTSRRRTVKGPTPASQFLVRIAAVDAHGTQSEWSDAILATAL
jgi:hypothetical protein